MTAPDKSKPGVGWVPLFLALAVIWGASFLFIKVAIRELHPIHLAAARVGIGALTLLVLLAVRRTPLPRDPRAWAHLLLVGTVGVAVPFTLFGYGEQRIPSVLAGIWNATTPLVALPVAVLVFRTERFSARRGVGIGLGFLGVLTVLGVWRGAGGAALTGQLMCFGAAVCYGLTIPYQRRFLAGRAESGLAIAAGQVICGAVVLAVVAPLLAGPPPLPTGLSPAVLGSVLAIGALGTGVAFVLHFRVIRIAGASTASSVTYLIPLVAAVIGVLALDERFSWNQPVGAMIVLLGVAVSQGALSSHMRRRSPVDQPREPAVVP